MLPRLREQQLLPVLKAGNFVIMNNLGNHKAMALRHAIKAAGGRLWYLPLYSPDLNPMEQTFAKVKHWLRLAQKRSIEDVWRYAGDLDSTIQPGECTNYSPTLDTIRQSMNHSTNSTTSHRNRTLQEAQLSLRHVPPMRGQD